MRRLQSLPGGLVRLRVIVALALLAAACNPARVQLTVRNPTAYPVNVEFTGTKLEGWVPLGLVLAGREKVFQEVLDAGEEWSFRFVHLDVDEQLTMDRTRLADSGWTVVVAESFGAKLQSAGIRPPDAPRFPGGGQTTNPTAGQTPATGPAPAAR